MPKNFLLGFGERLTERMEAPKTAMDKILPYTFEESVYRLEKQVGSTLDSVRNLPNLACPQDKTVVSFILHPEFTAKSYYPEALFRSWNLEQVGSRMVKIKPEKWTKKREVTEVVTTEIFVAGKKSNLEILPNSLKKVTSTSAEGMELSKIESIQPLSISEKLIPIQTKNDHLTFEAVLHASAEEFYLVEGFKAYLKSLNDVSNINDLIFAKGLCFLSLEAHQSSAIEIAKYSFLRVLREMPKLRGFEPALRSTGVNFPISLPDEKPLDPNLRVAIFDGGLPDSSLLSKWVKKIEIGKLGRPIIEGLNHGQWVSSAFLFGSLDEGTPPNRPYAYADLYRVFDTNDGDANLLKVLKRIKNILSSTNYNFINISCGPDIPVEDTDVHAWTSVLDEIFSDGSILATLAAGNNGERDWDSGNARIQPPSDCVNGLCIGAADSQRIGWKRANYSCIGPGRLPGYIKPDLLGFGGSTKEFFWVISPDNSSYAVPITGTSFAAPLALRTAAGIRSIFGVNLSPLAIKALLVHSSEKNNHNASEVGWGRLNTNIDAITSCADHCIRVVYQGKLNPGEWLKVPIPLPNKQIQGKVQIKATLSYATPTDPQDSVSYTQSGLEIIFRPHEDKKKDPNQEYPNSKPFFSSSRLYENLENDEKRHDSHRWEPTISSSRSMLGRSLKNPEFNLHYIAREGGNKSKKAQEIPYALVVEVSAPREVNLYNQVFNRFRTVLEILNPTIEVQIQT